MTIIGPGSEWFWAMAQLIVVAVSLGAVYRQLRAQGAANSFARIESIQRHWESRVMTLARLRASLHLKNSEKPELDPAGKMIADFLEDIADLQERGYLSTDEVVNNWGFPAYLWWQLLGPAIEQERRREQATILNSGFESLARLAQRELGKQGVPIPELDEAGRRKRIDRGIELFTGQLEILYDAEAGRIPSDGARASTPRARSEPTSVSGGPRS